MSIKLFDFQHEAVSRAFGVDSILNASDMGTGKTYMTMGELAKVGLTHNVLIVCPNSVKAVWEDAIKAWFPKREYLTLSGSTKRRIDYYGTGFLIVNWEALRLLPELAKIDWDFVIADEAHKAKNRKAKMTRALKRIKATYKRALTGTPMINRPDELWSILNWLYPGKFRSYWWFYEEFVDYYTDDYGYRHVLGPKNIERLHALLTPIMIRYRKQDVLPELPDKYYTTIRVDLDAKQRRAYDAMKRDSLAWLEQLPEDQPLPAPTVLAQLTRLRQFASAYCEIYDPKLEYDTANSKHWTTPVRMTEPSTKLDAMMEILSDTDEPVVIFSQFKQLIKLAFARLNNTPGPFGSNCMFTGDTPERERGEMIKEFQEGKVRIFLVTTQAGGVGITLHRASTAIFLDKTWSPATNLQAEDRLHRIGQANAVQIISIEANDTVDRTIEAKLQNKLKWLRAILNDPEGEA